MLITRVRADNFLSFDRIDMHLCRGLTVVAGPNGVGKTNLSRCIDLARTVLVQHSVVTERERLDVFSGAGRDGSDRFRIALAITLDQPWERDLVLAFVRAAASCSGATPAGTPAVTAAERDADVRRFLVADSLAPLWDGTLHVHYDAALRSPWFAAWEFEDAGQVWHMTLIGSATGQLRAGAAEALMTPSGAVADFGDRLVGTAPQARVGASPPPAEVQVRGELLLRTALPEPGDAISVRVASPTDMSSPVPASLRDLAAGLRLADSSNRSIEFVNVLAAVLQRGLVLTDNRRVPFTRTYSHADFDRPLDLRDGGDVPAELCRLKNGTARQRDQYRQIVATVADLTGQQLGLRVRIEPPHVSDHGLITVEPTVVGEHGEYPVEFAGAGVQEALILSTLLSGEPGRVFILDEPAAHLAPTVQRRLTNLLRSAGQCVVITHSPDSVPIDSRQDLANIVRLGPTAGNGARVWRKPAPDHQSWSRWAKLLQPTHIRALLFASAVILTEGETEVGALPRWWSNTSGLGLPSPDEANIPIIGVGGDGSYGAYVEYLDAFGIPWAIIADGPAMRPNSRLARQLRRHQYLTTIDPDASDDFDTLRPRWQTAGVFTIADQFGDDGDKGGEFEALLERVDPELLARVQDEVGATTRTPRKPQVGALFAAEHPNPPEEILAVYQLVMQHFGHNSRNLTTQP